MPRGRRLSEFEKGKSIAYRDANKPIREIAELVERSKTVMGNLLKDPENYIKKKKEGRPTKVSPRLARTIHRKLSTGLVTIMNVKMDLNTTLSRSTILRAAH